MSESVPGGHTHFLQGMCSMLTTKKELCSEDSADFSLGKIIKDLEHFPPCILENDDDS